MPGSGELEERVTFQRKGLDANREREGPWNGDGDGFSRWAKVIWLKGSERVLDARLQGVQPVVVTLVDEPATRAVDNSWRMVGASPRILGMIFDIKSPGAPSRDRGFLDFTAEQNGRDGGP